MEEVQASVTRCSQHLYSGVLAEAHLSSVSFPFFPSASLWSLFIDPEELTEWDQLRPHVLCGWE
ncbi:unnamed protein product [Prunus armeniaca]|uniref:Uncharacterized protein n=1 Tax=Prunus armeniaca TaxID=36596 RepID=A0A6J5U9G3_PRUAR|nr:unnamed protein product [Prunus armeniaca]